jgi:regulator of protease activity HflC (stomatin/prohibitin superfamily)
VIVPVGSADAPFIFNEITSDFQAITVQGQLIYRVQDPKLIASLLNYTVMGTASHYISEDPQKLPQRLINLLQVLVRAEVQRLPLRSAIYATDTVATSVLAKLKEGSELAALGVEVLGLAIQAIRPVPEMARALEAEAREELLRRADQAIYDRRNSAVEQERKIKENELNTEIAVEEKKRQIRETMVEADLSVEAKEQQVRTAKLKNCWKRRKQLITARETLKVEWISSLFQRASSLKLDALYCRCCRQTQIPFDGQLASRKLYKMQKIGTLNIHLIV